MATVVPAKEMGGATAGGQFALTVGELVALPIFVCLADTVGYRGSWPSSAVGRSSPPGLCCK